MMRITWLHCLVRKRDCEQRHPAAPAASFSWLWLPLQFLFVINSQLLACFGLLVRTVAGSS
jgi:hypothetical protein